ncbi:MAG: hypothetical protein KIT80_12275 [Chitinophagaceae bacterium]|nr:hypothetical protein [Chitinophagaceae bacterium]MCW5927679.1 hypothetical protein [Chitinophagaceae bacterium]
MKRISVVIRLFLYTSFFSCAQTSLQENVQQEKIKAFYIGHSLSDGIPEMLWGLTQKEDTVHFEYGYQRINGSPLRHQWNQMLNKRNPEYIDQLGNEMLKVFDSAITDPGVHIYPFYHETGGLPSGQYTHLVLTESVPRYLGSSWGNIEDTYRYVDSFYNYTKQFNPDIKPYLYEVWHCIKSGTPTGCDYDRDARPFRERLTEDLPMWEEVVKRFNKKDPRQKMKLIPVGQAIGNLSDAIERREVPGIHSIKELFSDDIHVNDTLRYLSACVHYATLFERDPTGLTNELNRLWGEPYVKLNQEMALLLQKIAWETVQQYIASKETP